ncbi:MAG: hypothetical protein PHE54_01340 [Bacilli bacterium]|nr:hypothetical protein [Bacilli bacterium]
MKNIIIENYNEIRDLGGENYYAKIVAVELINFLSPLDILLLKKMNLIGDNLIKLYLLCCGMDKDIFYQTLIIIRKNGTLKDHDAIFDSDIIFNLSQDHPIPFVDKNGGNYIPTCQIHSKECDDSKDAWVAYFKKHAEIFKKRIAEIRDNNISFISKDNFQKTLGQYPISSELFN